MKSDWTVPRAVIAVTPQMEDPAAISDPILWGSPAYLEKSMPDIIPIEMEADTAGMHTRALDTMSLPLNLKPTHTIPALRRVVVEYLIPVSSVL